MSNPEWPVLVCYDANHLRRIALPLGGIGTGTVSLGGRGDLRDWEVMNRPAKGFVPRGAFQRLPAIFCPVYPHRADAVRGTRMLEGPLELDEYEGASGSPAPQPRACRGSEAVISPPLTPWDRSSCLTCRCRCE